MIKAIPIFKEAANQMVDITPKSRINKNALDSAPNTAPKVLKEYKVPTSRPANIESREIYLLKTGSVAPISEVGKSNIEPQMKNRYKLA